jgi:ribonuclease HI
MFNEVAGRILQCAAMIEVFFDGLCDPNPGGVATYGFLVRKGGKKLKEGWGLACPPRTPQCTNNVAEYTGLIRALEFLCTEKLDGPLRIRGDSDLVVRQVKGEYKVKSPLLAPLHRRVGELLGAFDDVAVEWIPRERNSEADALTNRALAEFKGDALPAPTSDVMTVDLVIAAPTPETAAELRKIGIQARITPLPGGATRVQADLPARESALGPLLAAKRRIEGS